MIKNNLVNFQTAKLLSKLKFNIPQKNVFTHDGKSKGDNVKVYSFDNLAKLRSNRGIIAYLRPDLNTVKDWLREEYNFDIELIRIKIHEEPKEYYTRIKYFNKRPKIKVLEDTIGYSNALQLCILESLNIIINE